MQEPKGSNESVAHSLGILISLMAAARIIDVPAGTETERPSIQRFTFFLDAFDSVEDTGVPKSLAGFIIPPIRTSLSGS